MAELIVRYLHFISLFFLFAALAVEYALISPELSRSQLQKLARVDSVYGLSAVVVLIAGFSLWFWVGKPASFYTTNGLFHLKIGLFIVVGLLSIYPTVFFFKSRRHGAESTPVPPWVIRLIKTELIILLCLPLLAVMMARGIGLH